jgi:hypothetical protein
MNAKGYALAIIAAAISAGGGLALVAAFITGDWRWLIAEREREALKLRMRRLRAKRRATQ